jgi:glycosyltransferase involved in cell wall biosynthesis
VSILVDVVIPTTGRPELERAVNSARAQQGVNIRLHVILDAPQRADAVAHLLNDGELTVTAGRIGGAASRNVGLAASASDFVAYLDDDDWWAPSKLATQVRIAQELSAGLVLSAAVMHESDGGTRLLPDTTPVAGALGDYLALRPKLKYGHGLVQSSCFLVQRRFDHGVRWDETLGKHQDWAYALDLQRAGAHIAFADEHLVHIQQGSTNSISRTAAWAVSERWLARYGETMSQRARADFVACHILRSALAARDVAGIRAAMSHLGGVRPHAAALIVGMSGVVRR